MHWTNHSCVALAAARDPTTSAQTSNATGRRSIGTLTSRNEIVRHSVDLDGSYPGWLVTDIIYTYQQDDTSTSLCANFGAVWLYLLPGADVHSSLSVFIRFLMPLVSHLPIGYHIGYYIELFTYRMLFNCCIKMRNIGWIWCWASVHTGGASV